VDDFPSALPNYRTGGWQGPYNDGTGGSVTPTNDNRGIYMDATYNGFAYAFRQALEFSDFDLAMEFVIPTRDYTPADGLVLFLRWHNTTYPDQSTCPDCAFPSADSGFLVSFHLGEGRVFVMDASGIELATRPFLLSIGGLPHEARVNMSHGVAAVYVHGAKVIEAAVPDSAAGPIGIQAYRVDVIVDVVRINVGESALNPTKNPETSPAILPEPYSIAISLSSFVIVFWVAAFGILRWLRRSQRPPRL